MIEAWRLDKEKYAKGSFTGEGARRVSGRWHQKGTSVVYVSDSISLAILEKFVHMGYPAPHIKFVCIKIGIPKSIAIETIPVKKLPADWKVEPPADSTKNIGTAWATSAKTAVLKVPSVLAPESWNYLLNPAHPDFGRIVINSPIPFSFDDRMWKTK